MNADEAEAEVDVVDDDEEESEIQVDYLLNTNTKDDDHQASLYPSHVYCSPQHMIFLNLDADEPSYDIFYNPYMRSEGKLKVGDHFRNKEDCVRAIKKLHMENSDDYTIDHINVRRYVILCHSVLCMFLLAASYRKRRDSWEISLIHPPHTCTATNIS